MKKGHSTIDGGGIEAIDREKCISHGACME